MDAAARVGLAAMDGRAGVLIRPLYTASDEQRSPAAVGPLADAFLARTRQRADQPSLSRSPSAPARPLAPGVCASACGRAAAGGAASAHVLVV